MQEPERARARPAWAAPTPSSLGERTKETQQSLQTAQETTVSEVRNFNSSFHSFQYGEMVFVHIVEKETTPLIKTATISLRLDKSR